MPQPLADQRDVQIALNGIGYVLSIGDVEYRITPGEALGLFTSLLHTLPEIPDGVRLAHHIRNGPRLQLRRIWASEERRVFVTGYEGYITVANRTIHRCRPQASIEAALARAGLDYGVPFTDYTVIDQPGSQELACKRAYMWIIDEYTSRKKISVPELFSKIRCGHPSVADFDDKLHVTEPLEAKPDVESPDNIRSGRDDSELHTPTTLPPENTEGLA